MHISYPQVKKNGAFLTGKTSLEALEFSTFIISYKNINDQALICAEGLRQIILRTIETWSSSLLIILLVCIWHSAVMISNIYFSLDLERKHQPTPKVYYYQALTCEHCVEGLNQIILRTLQAWNSIFMIIALFLSFTHRAEVNSNISFSLDLEPEPAYIELAAFDATVLTGGRDRWNRSPNCPNLQ